jgi:hypothetical protein
VPDYESYLERLHPDDREQARQVVARCLETGEPYSFDHRVVRRDGTETWLNGRGRAVVDEEGNIVKLQGTSQDVTESKAAEDAARRLDEVRMRQRHALEVNDDIIQGLAVADLALNLDDVDKAKEVIASTLASARRFVTDLLGDDEEALPIAPGDLRRRERPAGD